MKLFFESKAIIYARSIAFRVEVGLSPFGCCAEKREEAVSDPDLIQELVNRNRGRDLICIDLRPPAVTSLGPNCQAWPTLIYLMHDSKCLLSYSQSVSTPRLHLQVRSLETETAIMNT